MVGGSKNLYWLACEAHEAAFGCQPRRMSGFKSFDDETAKKILAAIVEGVPYDETPEGYNPKNPDHRIG
jgi:hypothetical protein